MRQAKDQREWDDALEVQVTLAGDNSTLMRLTQSGTLLLPPLERAGSVQPIVPMGAVIEQLGYSLVWSAGSCKLYPPNGKALRLRVKNGCPEVVESQALTLISRLEEHKLQQVEELRRRTEQGKDRIRQAKLAMDKTWWDHLVDYVSSPNTGSGQMAVSTAPFFQEVPDKALQGILPPQGVDAEPFWDAIKKALPHLNRRRRKALHQSKNWVVHLFAGAKPHKPLMKLESDDTVVLELDIQRSAAQNVYNDALWSLLLRAAREGRLAAVLGGPPCRTMSVLRHRPGGPRPVRSPAEPFGLSTLTPGERELVDHDTGLFARMLWLHATSTAGRRVHRPQPHFSSMVAFLLEQPQQVERYMAPGNPLFGEVPSWWSNPMWLSYAAEAGLFEVDFNQGPLGHVSDKPTTIGTNLPDLRDLQGLKGEPKGPWSGDSKLLAEWAPGFVQAIARALQTWPRYRLVRMTPADWEQHVANNHIPFRQDCAVCVHGSGTGRRHVGVAHPDVYCMSADVAGPIRVEGRDPESRNHRPATFKYFLAVSYRFPRLKGVKEEPDPTTAEGFEDPALLPGGTDDLADEDPIEQIGDRLLSRRPKGEAEVESREDYEDSLYQPSGGEEEDEHEHGHGVRAAKVEEEHPWETVRCDYEAPSDLARLVFCVPLHNNRSAEVLDALQQVYIELRSLNLPVLRFHTDRGREFCNAKVRAWFHHRGVRTTTREANAPQQNGTAEQAIRWLKARARTLLRQAKAGSELWPCAMATAATQQRSQQLGLKSKLAAPFGAKCSVRLKFFHNQKGDLEDRWVEGMYLGLSPTVNDGHVVLRNDGKGNGFVQTLHVRTNLVSPDPPPLEFVGDSLEPEHPPPLRASKVWTSCLLKTRCQHLRYHHLQKLRPLKALCLLRLRRRLPA